MYYIKIIPHRHSFNVCGGQFNGLESRSITFTDSRALIDAPLVQPTGSGAMRRYSINYLTIESVVRNESVASDNVKKRDENVHS